VLGSLFNRGILFLFPVLTFAQEYARDIHPIWKKYCFSCHFTGVKMGGLELGTYEELMRGGNTGQDIVARQSSESRLFLMLTEKYQPYMPLGGTRLTAGELEAIRSWIDAGAKGPAKPSENKSR